MINAEKYMGRGELVVVQYKYWVITKFICSDYLYLNHLCRRNRREFEKKFFIDCAENKDTQCRMCGSRIPKQIKMTYNLLRM